MAERLAQAGGIALHSLNDPNVAYNVQRTPRTFRAS